MKFGAVPVGEAEGAILAHSLKSDGLGLRKGRVLSGEDIAALQRHGIAEVVVAALEAGDVGEDEAALQLARKVGSQKDMTLSEAFTGRVNIIATAPGVLTVDARPIDALNAVDPAITVATLPDLIRVGAGDMLATIKIIPYAVPQSVLKRVLALCNSAALQLHKARLRSARLVLTQTPGFSAKLLTKGEATVVARLRSLGVEVRRSVTVPHETGAVAEALDGFEEDLALVLGASATSDIADVCPSGVIAAGGTIERFGMPVDPGNLLFLGTLGGRPVIGLPGCARSPALNGVDWVLERVVCGIPVTSGDIAGMGVGGLLKEIPTRPQPRAFPISHGKTPQVTVILLAAGASRRMRGRDKLLEPMGDMPLLRHAASEMLKSAASDVLVVLPPASANRRKALEGLGVQIVEAARASEGMAASLTAGLAEIASRADAVVIALADMPDVTSAHVDALVSTFSVEDGREICRVVTGSGKRGHPVLFGRRFFEPLGRLAGDEGAREVLAANRDVVVDVRTDGEGGVIDLDTPEAWAAYREGR